VGWWCIISCKIVLKTHYPHHPTPPQPPATKATAAATTNTNKHTNKNVTKYKLILPEDTTRTVPSVADKQKTVTQYISQEEKSEILNSRPKG